MGKPKKARHKAKRSWREDDKVFCYSFRHWRSGKEVRRANGKPFCFTIKRRS